MIAANRNDGFINNEQTVKASLAQDHAFATFVATPLFTGAPDLAAATRRCRRSSGTSTRSWPGTPTSSEPSARSASTAPARACRSSRSTSTSRRSRCSRYGVTGVVEGSARQGYAGQLREVPVGEVVYFDDTCSSRRPISARRCRQMKQKGVQLIFTCIDQNETLILGKELVKQHLNAVQNLPNAYDPKFVKQNAQYLEGDFVAPQFVAFEYQPQLPVDAGVRRLDAAGSHKPISELAGYGWIDALEFVTGLKLAGPNFSQQKLIDAPQPGHGTSTPTA